MFKIIFIILKRRKYFFTALFGTTVAAVLSYFLTVLTESDRSLLIYADMNGLWYTVFTILLGAIISIFLGIYLALLFFKLDLKSSKIKNGGLLASSGSVLGTIASGCPTCGAPILALLGAPLGLMALPFRGLEIKLLSVSLLFLSVYLITKNIKSHLLCKVKK